MVSRRTVLRGAALGGVAVAAASTPLIQSAFSSPRRTAAVSPKDALPGGSLDPTTIPKYVTPLFVLPAMPRAGTVEHGSIDNYSIAARQIQQQVLPSKLPATPVWAYGSLTDTRTFHAPSYTVEAQVDRQVRVLWANQLVDKSGNFLPSLLPVDQTLHWANPPGGVAGRDSIPTFSSTPGPYTGPVPIVTHLHGAHTIEDSDGYPEAWFLPVAKNIPAGYATVGSFYDQFKAEFADRTGVEWQPGTSVYQYTNDQRATHLWFHDHTLGMTRVVLHPGLYGNYILRGGPSDLPPGVLPGRSGQRNYEISLEIKDHAFNTDGSLFFPDSRGFFGDTPPDGPWIPDTDTPPLWNPESFGNTMVVNGNTWPVLQVEPRRYRFRVLNACNTRALMLKVASDPLATRPATPALPLWQIGADGGFLPAPTQLDRVLLGVAERADVIVDFTGVPVGTELFLINEGPDEPFGGGEPETDFDVADPGTTGQVMKFVVGHLASPDQSVPPDQLKLPGREPLGPATSTRQVSLNELDSQFFADAPILGALGTLNPDGTGNALSWMDPVTENPAVGATEIWEMSNFTEDAHPIHVHLVQFEVINRQPFGGAVQPPESWETGTKDTVLNYPGTTTRVKAHFDVAGRFVWHCHILDHEDNSMMRAYTVG